MMDVIDKTEATEPAKLALADRHAAAILLLMLDDEAAASVLAQLDPQQIRDLGAAMYEVADVSEGEVASVFEIFTRRVKSRTTIGVGADARIRSVMQRALGHDRAETVLSQVSSQRAIRTLEPLRWMDARSIAATIEHEHPQVAAVVLAQLDATEAADVLQLLPEAMQPGLIYRIARLDTVPAEALQELELILAAKLATATVGPEMVHGGLAEAARIVNNMRPDSGKRIIKSVVKLDRPMALKIEEEMFVFDDLAALDDKNLASLLREVDTKLLVIALKGADAAIRERFFAGMSSRAADSLRDEIAELAPLRLAEVHDAQRMIVGVARRMADSGSLMLAGRGEDYV